jgi:hypothetical protein
MTSLIRRATPADRTAILELAIVDGVSSLVGEALVAISGGAVVSAIGMRDGRMVGDTAPYGAHLRERRMRVLTARHFARAAA